MLLNLKNVLHRSTRVTKLSECLKDYNVTNNCSSMTFPIQQVFFAPHGLLSEFICLMSNFNKVKEPKSMNDVLCNLKWKLAMDKEIEALINSNTGILTKLHAN